MPDGIVICVLPYFPSHMRKFLLLLGALGFASPVAQAQAQTTAKATPAAAQAPLPAAQHAAALDLLIAMQMKQQLASQTEMILKSQEAAQAQLVAQSQEPQTPERKAQRAELQTKMREFYKKSMSWDAVKEDLIQAYGHTFTTKELRELTAFYRSSLGQLLLRKQPEAARLVAAATQRRVQVLMPEMQRMMQALRK
ncbi:DUF2059 domain-containing protein [Hymenobacter nivis]|uniref:DUF2059 domain-containing protein n=2 Tax=Hymenobacter nivis TaxID=1850093 RepID=A0A502H1E8_9BACT|nr:DUF2059 domain-containing protein [Hymenobacter nivis]